MNLIAISNEIKLKYVSDNKFANLKGDDLPVTNPGLERWILLLTQLGQPKTEEDEIIYKLYFRLC